VDEISNRYRRRADDFARRIAAVKPDQWSNQSPCEDWTARDVVGHIVDMHAGILGPFGREPSPAASVAQDPVAAFRSARADVESLLADPELAQTLTDTPAGYRSAADYVDNVISDDLPLHGWDLARATGQDDTIDPRDLNRIWEKLTDLPAGTLAWLRASEVFGPEVLVPERAPLQERLLGLIGRDSRWLPSSEG
jgi:uncharacterized protein (TIGR03086 family)